MLEFQCECGAQLWPDSFEHPKKPVEWFMRCSHCGFVGPSASTEEESISEWQKQAFNTKQ